MSGLDPGKRAGFEEALNALVPETPNHVSIVACGATRCNFCDTRPRSDLFWDFRTKLI